MAGLDTSKIEAEREHPDSAWTEPDENGNLTPEQFSARVDARIEEEMQHRGYTQPPGPDAVSAEIEQPPAPVEDEPEEEVPAPAEPPPVPAEEEEEGPGPEEDDEEHVESPEHELEDELDEAEAFYVGRYRDRDAAEQGLAEKDATIDRLYKELHERGQRIEQAYQEAQQAEPLDQAAWAEWAREAVMSGAGENGALEALKHGGREGYNIYLAAWLDDEDQRGRALAFNNEVVLQLAEQTAANQTAELRAQAAPSQTEQAEIAKARVAAAYPDFGDYEEQMDKLINEPGLLPEQTKNFLADLARTGVDGMTQAWDYLYMAAAATSAPARRQAASVEKKRRKAAADRAKVAATVSSAEGAAVRTPPPEAELQVIQLKNRLRERWGLELLPED